MAEPQLGVIAAGHPVTARVGADVLRDGGNAVDAALASMLASFACEPLLTGLGAGGYMLVVAARPRAGPARLLRRGAGPGCGRRRRAPSWSRSASRSAMRSRCSTSARRRSARTACPPGCVTQRRDSAGSRWRRWSSRRAALARDGVRLNPAAGIRGRDPGRHRHRHAGVRGAVRAGGPAACEPATRSASPSSPRRWSGSGPKGAAPFYSGDIAAAIVDWVARARRDADRRRPRGVCGDRPRARSGSAYRGRDVAHQPAAVGGRDPDRPCARAARRGSGGARQRADRRGDGGHPERAHAGIPGRARRSVVRRAVPATDAAARPSLGSTTHIAVLDRDGWACSVTCSNGSCSGVVVPGTGVHLNNMLGEQDLNPLGFHRHPPGRRMPSMMAPTIVLRDGRPELVLGSAGSNRIRSAILQTIIRVVDDGLRAGDAVQAPRVHFEDGVVYAEPGDRHVRARGRPGARSAASASATCSSAACRRSSGTGTAGSGAAVTRDAAGRRSSSTCRRPSQPTR